MLPQSLGITPRGRSHALNRALSDFGIEDSFVKASWRFKEHYGFKIPASAVREATLQSAARANVKLEAKYQESFRTLPLQGAEYVLAEADGTMICTIEPAKRGDAHPRAWKEMRLVAGREEGKVDAVFGGGFLDVDEAGRRWGHCVRDAGWAMNTTVHAVNDGAPWIDHQVDDVFGLGVSKLCDFYHVSEYICAAAKSIAAQDPKSWSTRHCRHLKTGEIDLVINELAEHLEPAQTLEEQAPVTAAWRYLNNRRDSLGYAEAIAKGLPIGSGLIESGHKHVLQARLKKAGSAWLEATAHQLAQLRVLRANNLWSTIWN